MAELPRDKDSCLRTEGETRGGDEPGIGKALGEDGWPSEDSVGGRLARQVEGFVAFARAVATVR